MTEPLPPYALTTPARDERQDLPRLFAALRAQEHRPALWFVVDDGSSDGTWEWLEETAQAHPWVVAARAPEPNTEYLGAHVARIKRWGLEQASQRAEADGIALGHLGVVDADITFGPAHYRLLAEALEAEPLMGVVSSVVRSRGPDGRYVVESFQRDDLPRGGTQFFKRACLDSIGGLPPYPGFDGAANVKARLRGWRCRLLAEVTAEQSRETATRFGAAAGYARKGRYAWFLGHHPLLVLARTAAYLGKGPRRGGLHFARAWVGEALRHAPRCPDPEVRDYYGKQRLKEYLRGQRFAR